MGKALVLVLFVAAIFLSAAAAKSQACHNNVVLFLDDSVSTANFRAEAVDRISQIFGEHRDWALDNPEKFTALSFGRGVIREEFVINTERNDRKDLLAKLLLLKTARQQEEWVSKDDAETDFRVVLNAMANVMNTSDGGRNIFLIMSDFVHDVKNEPGREEATADVLDWYAALEEHKADFKKKFDDPGRNSLVLLVAPTKPNRSSDVYRQTAVISSLSDLILPRRIVIGMANESWRNAGNDLERFLLNPLWLEPRLNQDRSLDLRLHNMTCTRFRVNYLLFIIKPNRGQESTVSIYLRNAASVPPLDGDEPAPIHLAPTDMGNIYRQDPPSTDIVAQGCAEGEDCGKDKQLALNRPQKVFFKDRVALISVSGQYEDSSLILGLDVWGHVGAAKSAFVEIFKGDDTKATKLGKSANIIDQLRDLRVDQQMTLRARVEIDGGQDGVCSKEMDNTCAAIVDELGKPLSKCRLLQRLDDKGSDSASEKPRQLLEHVSLPLAVVLACSILLKPWKGSMGWLADALTIFLIAAVAAFDIYSTFQFGRVQGFTANHMEAFSYVFTFMLVVLLIGGFQMGIFDPPRSLEILRTESRRRRRRRILGMAWGPTLTILTLACLLLWSIRSHRPVNPCRFDCLPQATSTEEP